jgi:hypothetical protein
MDQIFKRKNLENQLNENNAQLKYLLKNIC